MRPRPNESAVVDIIGDIKGKKCIIIDDIIDTAGTITNAANYLIEKGAEEVYITASHAIFSGKAIENIKNSKVAKCVVTDSIPLKEACRDDDKFDVVSIRELLAETIRRIYTRQSISGLFK